MNPQRSNTINMTADEYMRLILKWQNRDFESDEEQMLFWIKYGELLSNEIPPFDVEPFDRTDD